MNAPLPQHFASHRLTRTLGDFAAEWDSLNHRLTGGHPMFDSRFVECLLRHFGRGDEILLRGTKAEDTLALMSILHRDRRGSWSSFLPSQTQVGLHLADGAIDPHRFFKCLPGVSLRINLLCQDPWFSPTRDSIARPCKSQHHALTMGIDLRGSFDEYWQSRSKKLASNLRRYRARVEQAGLEPRMLIFEGPHEMADAVARYGRLESAGWKAQQGTAVSEDNAQGAFYRDLLESFAATGQATVYEYWIGERLAASRLTIRNDKMLIMLKTAFDESMSEFAAGRLLLHEVIREAFRVLPGGRIEFYTHATVDQLAWATDRRHIDHFTLYANQGVELLAQVRELVQAALHRSPDDPHGSDPETPRRVGRWTHPDQIPAAFSDLFAASEAQSFDLGRNWFRNFVTTVDDPEAEPLFLTADVDGQARALLPLRILKRGFGTRATSLTNYYSSLFAPLLTEGSGAQEIAQLITGLNEGHPKISHLRFSPLDPLAPSSSELRRALQLAGYFTFSYFCFGNWYLPVSGNWNEVRNGFRGEVRSTVRRMGKKFAAAGGSLEIITSPEKVEEALAAFQKVYASSWKIPEPHQKFMPGFVRMLADGGHLRLGVAKLGDTAVAAQVWVVGGSKASIYKLAHDERQADFSPGTLLTAHLMEHVIEQDGVREVDFLIGDDTYKRTWMSHRRERWGLVAYNPTTLGGICGLLAECAGRTAKRFGLVSDRREN